MPGEFYGIGVGPGDPELLTIKAVNVIRKVDVIIAPKTEKQDDSIALNIARPFLKENAVVIKLVFPMVFNSETLSEAWENNKNVILKLLSEGKKVAFLTLGDPMLYSTYIYVFRLLENCGYPIETVPGIPSFCAIASKLGYTLAEGDEILMIVPSNVRDEKLDQSLALADSMALLKVYRNCGQVVEKLREHGLAGKAAMISKCGLEGEQIRRNLNDFAVDNEEKINYLSTILVRKNGTNNAKHS